MNKKELSLLLLEEKSLNDMLSKISVEDVIERNGLEYRLSEIRKLVEQFPDKLKDPVNVKVTFKGKPVFGTHGILALFGSKAISQFIDIVDKLVASQSTTLGERGRIPNRGDHQLIITNTALGSFGFQLEEFPDEQLILIDEPSPIEIALKQALELLKGTLGSDDELSESVSNFDLRTLSAIEEFLAYVAEQGATCAIQFDNNLFEFDSVEQTKRSSQRLSKDNIREKEERLEGEVIGVLPVTRTFEFKLQDTQEVIKGKITSSILNPDEINSILHKKSSIQVLTTWIGCGKPRYKLLDMPQLKQDSTIS